MQPELVLPEFKRRLGQDESGLTLAQGVAEMVRFYREERADGCSFDEDQDMLLFEWGGDGERFELIITRQFIFPELDDDEGIWQLSLTFCYATTPALMLLSAGDRWCENLEGVTEFTAYVEESPAFRAVANAKPQRVELSYECAG
jgi:hypothetical protein